MAGKLVTRSAYKVTIQIYGLAERKFTMYVVAEGLEELMDVIRAHEENMVSDEEQAVSSIKLLDWPGVYMKEA